MCAAALDIRRDIDEDTQMTKPVKTQKYEDRKLAAVAEYMLGIINHEQTYAQTLKEKIAKDGLAYTMSWEAVAALETGIKGDGAREVLGALRDRTALGHSTPDILQGVATYAQKYVLQHAHHGAPRSTNPMAVFERSAQLEFWARTHEFVAGIMAQK
jgi:hypothetical protein